jgi:hypothetical protein
MLLAAFAISSDSGGGAHAAERGKVTGSVLGRSLRDLPQASRIACDVDLAVQVPWIRAQPDEFNVDQREHDLRRSDLGPED